MTFVEGFDTYNQDSTGEVAHTLRISTDNGLQSTPHVAGTLGDSSAGGPRDDRMTFVAHSLSAVGADASEDGTGRGTPLVPAYWDGGQVADTLDVAGLTKGQMMPEKRRFPAVITSGVRRLTPTECERLQGLPDGWTLPGSDSKRYAGLGDAVTANVAEWIGRRLIKAHD